MGNICNVEPLQAQGTVVVDSAQSISSENPLQNKVVTIEKANASALCVDLSGNPITFNADSQAVQKLVVTLEPIQEGSGTPSPENVRPISGRTGTGVVANGKNLLNPNTIQAGKVVNFQTGAINRNASYWTSDYIDVHGLSYISCSGTADFSGAEKWFYDKDKNPLQRATLNVSVIPVPTGAYYYCFSRSNEYSVSDGMIERGNTATDFEPYKTPVSCSIQFGQTVYGGTVDFKTGKVRVTHQLIDMGSVNWTYNSASGHQRIISDVITGIKFISNDDTPDMKCSAYKTDTSNNVYNHVENGTISINDAYKFVAYDSQYTDGSAFKTAMTGQKIAYPLATPTELTLTPSELQLLKGYNYITADGNMEISIVPEDVIGYTMGQIISAMGTDESGRTTASRAYTTGEYFYKDGKMYKALTSIASGATFTVGTNCSQTTLFAELKAAQN